MSAPGAKFESDRPPPRNREGEPFAERYQLGAKLGSGGMGDVYRARNLVLGRDVAVKILRAEVAQDPIAVARFLREARATALVSHPNVVQILDAGTEPDGTPYIVQELLEGQDLAGYLNDRGGRLPVMDAIELMRPVVDAMAVAHRAGVVHRDLKPENVFLCPGDDGLLPKILDFGISKILRETGTDHTKTGVIIGTPHYMSPEQITGAKTIDARADVWSLGVMIHELIAGDLPFPTTGSRAIFVRIALDEPISLDRAVPDAPADLVRIIGRCLRREPSERYPSAAELARDLRYVREARPIEPTQRMAIVMMNAPPTIDPRMHPSRRRSMPAPRPQAVTQDDTRPTSTAPGPNPSAPPRTTVAPTPPRTGSAIQPSPRRPAWWTFVIAVVLAIAVAGARHFVRLRPHVAHPPVTTRAHGRM